MHVLHNIFQFCHKHNSLPLWPTSPSAKELHDSALYLLDIGQVRCQLRLKDLPDLKILSQFLTTVAELV